MNPIHSENSEQNAEPLSTSLKNLQNIEHPTQANTSPSKPRPMHLVLLKGIVYLIWGACIVSLGAIYGVTAYSFFENFLSVGHGVMLPSFLFGVPFSMGILVAYLAHLKKMSGLAVAGSLSMLSLSLFAFAVGALFREGTICLIMALGLFIPLMLLGALISVIVSWVKPQQSGKLSAFVFMMPFAFGSVEQHMEAPTIRQKTERSVYVEASPEKNLESH